jgi:hypothetical protein
VNAGCPARRHWIYLRDRRYGIPTSVASGRTLPRTKRPTVRRAGSTVPVTNVGE